MKNNKTILGKFLILMGIIILLSANVFAFAVSSAYWEQKALEIYPGETKEIKIYLQNSQGEELLAKGVIVQGVDIAKFVDEDPTYKIPVGPKVEIILQVTMPGNAKAGDNHTIELSFTTITEEEGVVSIGGGVQKIIPVTVLKKPSPEIGSWIYLVIIILILLIIGIIKVISKKKSSKKRK